MRVTSRKSLISFFAEILAFVAGLSFQAKLIKYLTWLWGTGRYFDRQFKKYKLADDPNYDSTLGTLASSR